MEEIKKKVDEIVNKVKNDGEFTNKFKENPVQAVESIIGTDLPDDQINGIVDMVKAKINIDNGTIGKITGLFNK
jgi:uncharacterized protein YpuA (DUF1002 family)